MNNALGRARTFGIAAESAFGTAPANPTYFLPVVGDPSVEEVVEIVENEAAMGNNYQVNDARVTVKSAKLSLTVKADENSLPLLLKQNYSITTTTYTGESGTVWQHSLVWTGDNNGVSYAVFLQDDNRVSDVFAGFKFQSIKIQCETKKYVALELSGRGRFRSTWTGSNTVIAPREFISNNVTFKMVDFNGSLATVALLSANLNHEFGLSDDDVNVSLGSGQLDQQFTTENRFESELTALYSSTTIRDRWASGTQQASQITIRDTDRYVSGSVSSTNPSIVIDYPINQIIAWAEEGGAKKILTQKFKLLALNKPGVTSAPAKFTIVNNVASY